MNLVGSLLLIAAAILAVSGLIIARNPQAKELIDKLVPYQGFLGVGLLAWGIIDLLRMLSSMSMLMDRWPLGGAIVMAAIVCEILLGFLFGMPLIAQWIPGQSPAEEKALAVQQKIAGFSVLIGLVGMIAAIGWILITFGVLSATSEYRVGALGT